MEAVGNGLIGVVVLVGAVVLVWRRWQRDDVPAQAHADMVAATAMPPTVVGGACPPPCGTA
jgi:hypothetical protein